MKKRKRIIVLLYVAIGISLPALSGCGNSQVDKSSNREVKISTQEKFNINTDICEIYQNKNSVELEEVQCGMVNNNIYALVKYSEQSRNIQEIKQTTRYVINKLKDKGYTTIIRCKYKLEDDRQGCMEIGVRDNFEYTDEYIENCITHGMFNKTNT